MRFRHALRASVLGGAVACVAAPAMAATITVPGSIDDFEAQRRSNTGVFIPSENFNSGSRAGFQTNFNGAGDFAPGGITSLYFFQLPVLAPGETINSASFSVGTLPDTAVSAATPSFNADLYALGTVDAIVKDAAAAERYFYLGNTEQTALADGTPVSRVADDFLDPLDFIPNGGTAAAAQSADLTNYIVSLYENAATNGFTPGTSYLVLRLNPDADAVPTSGTQRYLTAFEGTPTNMGAGSPENRPLITLDVVPEPGSAGLLLLGSLGVLAARRRRA